MEKEATFVTPFGEGAVLVEDGRLAEVRLPYVEAVDGRPAAVWPAPQSIVWRDAGDHLRARFRMTLRRQGAMGTRGARTQGAFVAALRARRRTLHHAAAAPHAADPRADIAAGWARELEAYFRGERLGWTDAEVGLEAYGFTPFRTAVYRALLGVPAGETVTYGELARRAGRPGAARAVGSAMAENPIAVVVPCHRVVRGHGSLGHYGFGDPWKRFLLEAEGALDTTGVVKAANASGGGSPLP